MASSGEGKISKGPQVFINYRGKELRNNFIAHLEFGLKQAKINYFLGKNEQVGTKLQNLLVRIEQSKVALVIFSKGYTTSVRCLDELAKIHECIDKGTLIGVPIFFRLKTTVVSNLEGSFGDKFRELKRHNHLDIIRTKDWEEAIMSITQINGMTLSETSEKSDKVFIESIIDKVKSLLDDIEMQEEINSQCSSKIEITHSENPEIRTWSSIEESPKTCSFELVETSSHVWENCPQVFINYRKKELRHTFIKHLLSELNKRQINYFINENKLKGKLFTDRFKKIEESAIALVIFSKQYIESKWCLEELVKMKKLVKDGELMVIPIFVNVTPSEVKKLDGEFGRGFKRMRERFMHKPKKIQKWKEAVSYIADISGLVWNDGYSRNSSSTPTNYFTENNLAVRTADAVKKELLRKDRKYQKKENHDGGNGGFELFVSLLAAFFAGYIGPRKVLAEGYLCSTVSWFVGIFVFFMIKHMLSPSVTTTPPPPPKLNEE